MERPQQDVIETFMSVTGASEAAALGKLEEHGGDLNAALNAYFGEGERFNSHPTAAPVVHDDDIMEVDQPIDVETVEPPFPLLSASRSFNPFSLLEEHISRTSFGGRDIYDISSRAPRVSHPREVREIPIDFKNDANHSSLANHAPNIEYVAEDDATAGPETFGHVTMNEEDEDHDDVIHNAGVPGRDNHDHGRVVTEPSARVSVVADDNDIEEEMIKAAIEASKHDALRHPSPEFDVSHWEEEERASHERVAELDEKTKIREEEIGASTSGTSRQILLEGNRSSHEDESEDIDDEQPLMRRSYRRPASQPGGSSKEVIELDDSPPSSPPPRDVLAYPQHNGVADEWGGMTSQEHDEAVMLEAAMFGGIPERETYKYAWPHRPPSPTLAAQRMLKEQQDDEYKAALQADRERELKEAAAKEAALQKEKSQEEEMRKKKLEEEEFERVLAAKLASLPAEPSADEENAVTLLVRMPDGSRHGRRFLRSDKLQSLFDFIDTGRVAKPQSYKLVRPYPRRAFGEEESSISLSDLGLTSKQEALFLELI